QMLLLCGYVYSHLVSARLSAVAQTKSHLALLAVVFLLVLTLMFLWPSAITPTLVRPPGSGHENLQAVFHFKPRVVAWTVELSLSAGTGNRNENPEPDMVAVVFCICGGMRSVRAKNDACVRRNQSR